MKINNNISAVVTNHRLLSTENSLTDVMEKLSSGFKINKAQDDPSGIAISNKMQAQIDALDQASDNAQNGISVLETADGAMNEIEAMLQRMRELAVQAATGTNSPTDRQAAQDEVESLRDEIDRITSTTEFNTKNLLNGDLDNRVYTDGVTRVQVSEEVAAGEYDFTIVSNATAAKISGTVTLDTADTTPFITDATAGDILINDEKVSLTAGMTKSQVYAALSEGAVNGGAVISEAGQALSFSSMDKGAQSNLSIEINNPDLAAALGLPDEASVSGTDAKITLSTGFNNTAALSISGDHVTITQQGGFEISMLLNEGSAGSDISLSVEDIGPMTMHIGANMNQNISVKIPSTSSESLYIDDIDVSSSYGAGKAITKLDDAISKVNKIRSSLGAYTNRLDYSYKALDETQENMTSAISRIEDVDMAEAVTDYTKYTVLQQVATSALSQANELPQMALQLLS